MSHSDHGLTEFGRFGPSIAAQAAMEPRAAVRARLSSGRGADRHAATRPFVVLQSYTLRFRIINVSFATG